MSYLLAASAFLASTHHRLSHSGPRSTPHLRSQHRDCMMQPGEGREAAGCCGGALEWAFPRGCSLLGGHSQPAGLPTCTTREDGGPGLNWPSSSNDPPSPQLHCVLFHFFYSGHKLGDVSTQQELQPMIIIFPQ